MLAENLARVQQRIRQACERRGRDPSSVTLVCVTKGLPLETIREAAALGVTELGENRVQEARLKQTVLGSRLKVEGEGFEPRTLNLERLKWHLIGHLQRNKAKDAVELFDAIHSIDSLALAEALERHAAARARAIEVFVQVNVSGETTKFGCRPDEASALARHIVSQPHLRLKGLMTIAPFAEDPEEARPYFRRLRGLRDEAQITDHCSLSLSMGMSHDFEVAIEEGADLVRIGTAIFKSSE
ncbi:MAG: YggS family pyridoxal phosphate-dependent enzyme [Candidatus Omnitrophica bacterium]|nr:YggS family pyridoxal phosphate-dependent enzyme [Candidatus Omnitrophota bacterium]